MVVTHRHKRGTRAGDVGGLTHRIREEARWDVALEPTETDFCAHRGIALEPRDRDEIEIEYGKLRQLGDSRLQRDRRQRRIDAGREVVERDLDDVGLDVRGPTRVVGERLQIGNQNCLIMRALQLDTRAERADIVAEVQRACWAVARENDLACRRCWGGRRNRRSREAPLSARRRRP